MIKNIIFDLGGVIMTISQPQAVSRFAEIGLPDAERHLDPYTQSGIFGDLEQGLINKEEFRSELSKLAGKQMTLDECAYAWRGYCKEVPRRNLDILRRLRTEGYRIILLSNTNPFMSDWFLSPDFDGRGCSLADYVDAYYLSYVLKVMKPDSRFFEHVLKAEGINPSESLFVDDGQKNVEAAARLGINTFRPTNGEDWTSEIYEHLNK